MTETSGKNYTNASRCQVCVENVQLTYPTYVTIDKIQQPAEKIEGRKNITINQFLFFSKTSFIYHILLQLHDNFPIAGYLIPIALQQLIWLAVLAFSISYITFGEYQCFNDPSKSYMSGVKN